MLPVRPELSYKTGLHWFAESYNNQTIMNAKYTYIVYAWQLN